MFGQLGTVYEDSTSSDLRNDVKNEMNRNRRYNETMAYRSASSGLLQVDESLYVHMVPKNRTGYTTTIMDVVSLSHPSESWQMFSG